MLGGVIRGEGEGLWTGVEGEIDDEVVRLWVLDGSFGRSVRTDGEGGRRGVGDQVGERA
jgi:hypothetical protein